MPRSMALGPGFEVRVSHASRQKRTVRYGHAQSLSYTAATLPKKEGRGDHSPRPSIRQALA